MKLSYRDMKKLEKRIVEDSSALGELLNSQMTNIEKEIILDAIEVIRKRSGWLFCFKDFLSCIKLNLVYYLICFTTIISLISFSISFIGLEIRVNSQLKKMEYFYTKTIAVEEQQIKNNGSLTYLKKITKPLEPILEKGKKP
jgi:hypothetical protein